MAAKTVAVVDIDRGKWTSTADPGTEKVWREAGKLFETLVNRAEMPKRRYQLRVIRKSRMKSTERGGIRIGPLEGQTIRLRIKPGDNGSVWEYALRVIDELDAVAVQAALVAANGQDTPDDKPEPVEVEQVLVPYTTGVRTVADEPDSGALLRGIQRVQEAIDRQANRERQLVDLESDAEQLRLQIDGLKEQLATLESKAAANERRQLEIMDEAEADEEAQGAEHVREALAKLFGGMLDVRNPSSK